MREVNGITGLNISIYHSFNDEVDSYRQHVWLCDGPCRKKPPFYGIVKRAMNQPPSLRDDWFPIHQKTCGGTFNKIAEPEGYVDKKKQKQLKEEAKKENNLDQYFKKEGKKRTREEAGIETNGKKAEKKGSKEEEAVEALQQVMSQQFNDDDDDVQLQILLMNQLAFK
ncbi:hypothetical protein FGO68_gene1687 [Halteria grandinella]|uniref:Spartan-like zinc binding domain-containing protein n=1 Tax=Halteria grandinella TaxID=5974 RepID=A0A8J8NM28_HALGN|nr:hypothetical protein FGO68_gene1687 [Halteria grandinella]